MHINTKIDITTMIVSIALTALLLVAGFAFAKDMIQGINPLVSYFGILLSVVASILFGEIVSLAYDNIKKL